MGATVVQAMLDCGINVCKLVPDALHDAVSKRELNFDLISMLITVCHFDVNARNFWCQSPLYIAILEGTLLSISVLLAAGADVNARVSHEDGESIFHKAMQLYEKERCLSQRMPQIRAFVACGADLDKPSRRGRTAREILTKKNLILKPNSLKTTHRHLAQCRLDLVRYRALAVCVALHSLRIDALQMCEILQYACGPIACTIPFHQWWKLATTVKHFKRSQQ
jgi:hypothetical protein